MKYFRISIPGYDKPQKVKHLKIGTLILITGFKDPQEYIVVEHMGVSKKFRFISASNAFGEMVMMWSKGYLLNLSLKYTMKVIDPIDLILYTDNKTDRYVAVLKGEP